MDWKTIEDEREKYNAYLCSREWALRRQKVIKRCGGICERCCDAKVTHVHHLTYARKYNERTEDLQGLCEPCHKHTHGIESRRPTRTWDKYVKGCSSCSKTILPLEDDSDLCALAIAYALDQAHKIVDGLFSNEQDQDDFAAGMDFFSCQAMHADTRILNAWYWIASGCPTPTEIDTDFQPFAFMEAIHNGRRLDTSPNRA